MPLRTACPMHAGSIYLLALAIMGPRLTQRGLNSHTSRFSHRPERLSTFLWSSYVEEVEKYRGRKQEKGGPAEVRDCQMIDVCSWLAIAEG